MSPPAGQRYSLSCWQISAGVTRTCKQDKSGFFPDSRASYNLLNIGMTEIYAEALYGTAAVWYGTIVGYTYKPGDEKVLDIGGRLYYVTGVRIYNKGKIRALVHIGSPNGWPWYEDLGDGFKLKIDISAIGKKLVGFGVSKIPYVGKVLKVLVDFFWPKDKKPSVWSQIKGQVEQLIDSKTNDVIKGILGGELKYMQTRIEGFTRDLEDLIAKHDVTGHFINIVEDLIGFEQKFITRKEDNPNYVNVNYFVLPLYSNFVTMKLKFYQFGLMNPEQLGLTSDTIYRVKNYTKRLLFDDDGVINYVKQVLRESIEEAYKTCDPDNIYDAIATARTFVGLNGMEFIEYWKEIYEHPESETKPYNTTITFSTHFCRPTPWHARQIVPDGDPEEVSQPLQPALINGKRNKITGIDIWIWRIRPYAAQKISGIKLYWEHGESTSLGKWTSEKYYLDFKGAYLTKLTAHGNGALDCLEFELSDGRSSSYGTTADSWNTHQTFELENHFISGILLSGGQSGLAGQAHNISVSYQLIPPSY